MKINIQYLKENKISHIYECVKFKFRNSVLQYCYKQNLFNISLVRYIEVDDCDIIDMTELNFRYAVGGRRVTNTLGIVKINDEEETFSNDDLFNITSWGADLSFRELISMYDENDLIKPDLQRKYVWSLDEASRLIDSILLGLPIPSIFLAKKDEKRLIIDGYQRIKTVYDFVNGVFEKNNKLFKLSNSRIINERWRGKLFKDLTEDEQRRIRNTTIHAIIFEQKRPNNDSGMYQIFERINTSGRTLSPQEIRNCIYYGNYNNMLMSLNKNKTWRKILNCNEDSRMLDVENILRFFAMKNLENTPDYDKNQIILKKFLNENMASCVNLSEEECSELENLFIKVLEKVDEVLGKDAFKNISYKKDDEGNYLFSNQLVNKFHPTIYEAIMMSFDFAINNSLSFSKVKDNHLALLNDNEFREAISIRTTNIDNIKKRVSIATKYLFGVDYEWK